MEVVEVMMVSSVVVEAVRIVVAMSTVAVELGSCEMKCSILCGC